MFLVKTPSGPTWTEVRDHEGGISKSVTSVSVTFLYGVKILKAVTS